MKALRIMAYLGFAGGALLFWALFYGLVLGIFPFPADPACSLEPAGCPPQPLWKQLAGLIVMVGTIPLTVLAFVFFRRWVRGRAGLDDGR